MGWSNLLILSTMAVCACAWSIPFYPVQGPVRVTRFAPHPPPHVIHHLRQIRHRAPAPVRDSEASEEEWTRPKRERDHDFEDHDDDYGHRGHRDYEGHRGHRHGQTSGVTGPVHTFVKTDKNANYKWGVRHHVGNKYAS